MSEGATPIYDVGDHPLPYGNVMLVFPDYMQSDECKEQLDIKYGEKWHYEWCLIWSNMLRTYVLRHESNKRYRERDTIRDPFVPMKPDLHFKLMKQRQEESAQQHARPPSDVAPITDRPAQSSNTNKTDSSGQPQAPKDAKADTGASTASTDQSKSKSAASWYAQVGCHAHGHQRSQGQ